jgi:hypothetical protein
VNTYDNDDGIPSNWATLVFTPKDCPNCVYRRDEWRDGGHCYFYRDEPDSQYCKHVEQVNQPKGDE